MRMDFVLAKKLASKGMALDYHHNTLFTSMLGDNKLEELSRSGIRGLANLVKSDIVTYRNVILPMTKEFEADVRAKAVVKQTAFADSVALHVYHYNDGIEALESLSDVDVNVVTDYTKLPSNPLVIKYDNAIVMDNINFTNNSVNEHLKEILTEYPAGYVEKIHTKVFDNVSNSNEFIKSLALDPLKSYNDAMITALLTIGYIKGTLGVTNIDSDKVRVDYLYTLRNMMITTLAKYRSIYQRYLESDVLIINISPGDKNTTDVYLVGEVYDKYLEEHNVDGIIGLTALTVEGSRITLKNVVDNMDVNLESYANTVREATIKSDIGRIEVLRTAYKMSASEYLRNLTTGQLAAIDITDNEIGAINNLVSEYVNKLSSDELLSITTVSRYISSVFIYNNQGFLVFIKYMNYYSKLFPTLDVDSIATSAMVSLIMDKLEPQLTVAETY